MFGPANVHLLWNTNMTGKGAVPKKPAGKTDPKLYIVICLSGAGPTRALRTLFGGLGPEFSQPRERVLIKLNPNQRRVGDSHDRARNRTRRVSQHRNGHGRKAATWESNPAKAL